MHGRARITGSALLLVNPAAGRARKPGAVDALAKALGARFNLDAIEYTDGPTDARTRARRAAEGGLDTVFVAGGDGTVNEAMHGLVGTDTCLCPLPMGTANVLCHELGLTGDPDTLAARLARRTPQAVTVGHAQWREGERHFLLMAGFGLDAAIVAAVDPAIKARLGIGAYYLHGALTSIRYRYPELTVTSGERSWHGHSVVLANARNYAGKFVLAPGAGLTRPNLQMVMFYGRGPASYVRYAAGVLMGEHLYQHGVSTAFADTFTVHGPEASVPGHLDGEETPPTPVTIRAVASALYLPLPNRPAAAQVTANPALA